MKRSVFVSVLLLCACGTTSTTDGGRDAGVDAGVPEEPICDPATPARPGFLGTYPCRALGAGPCRLEASAQGRSLCVSHGYQTEYAVCGPTEVWILRDSFLLRECIYEDGGLVGFRQLTDGDGSPDSYMGGRWRNDCAPDGGVRACFGQDGGSGSDGGP